ncbi:hypothetical protein [Actinomadura litoris]|uniref:Uncharacterized protein n=1 Tax=Actinomadura litoris TaxID=2678616 RepID=A0A7K1LB35_9ACTN|nr:hypothetical protein [Actinomadura litoris]MUN41637.1 hypothetical protein [Actinomadura litoris]
MESRWATLARAKLDHAQEHGATGTGAVISGDARHAHVFDPPPRPATLRTMSPQLKNLARLLHLDDWAQEHLP